MQHDCKVSPYNSLAHENVLQYCPSQTKTCEIQRQETKDKQENRREKKQRTMRKAARLSTFFSLEKSSQTGGENFSKWFGISNRRWDDDMPNIRIDNT